ncbi:MAG: sugar ABC transporter substrate-binding protein [Clostridiales bacterium]|nr:sugar ABC transporter substrate-binding protein [Clostridiales bacterium]
MKKVLALVLVLLLALTGTVMAEGKVFGYTAMTMLNPFFIVIEEAIREVVEANGDTLITFDPAMDNALQISQIEDAISKGVQLMFVNAADKEGIIPAMVQLQAAGIPVVNYDAEVADYEKYVAAYVGSNNYNAGYVCGEDLAKRHPDGGNIVILDYPMAQSVVDRINGFNDAIAKSGVKFNVVAQQAAMGDLQKAMGIMDDILQREFEGGIIAAFGGNDPTALGIYASCLAAGRTEIEIYGVDGSPDAKKAIAEKGQFIGSGAQSPINIGKLSVEVAYKILNGEQKEFVRVPVDTFLINQENVEQFGVEGWQ